MTAGRLAAAMGKGLLAGLAGTAAMTASSTLEQHLRGREPSTTPADVAFKALGVQPRDEAAKARLSNLVHWGYGTAWGAARGLVSAAGLTGPEASAVHFLLVWGAGLAVLPAFRVSPPVSEWKGQEIATDALHHAVYAAATGAAYDCLERDPRP